MTLSHRLAALLFDKKITVEDCVSMLSTYKLTTLMPTILRIVKNKQQKNVAYNTIIIESPFPLQDTSVTDIKRIIGNDMAKHESFINKDLLAGFRARFKGKLYDASAQRIIEQLK